MAESADETAVIILVFHQGQPAEHVRTVFEQDKGRVEVQHPALEELRQHVEGIHSSSWQTGMASTSTAASGFTSRTWTAPDPNPTGWFKVRILLWWVNPSGTSKMKVEYDHYQGKWNGTSDERSGNDYCLQDW